MKKISVCIEHLPMYEWLKLIVNVGKHNIDGVCRDSLTLYHLSCRLHINMYSPSGLRPPTFFKVVEIFFSPHLQKHTPLLGVSKK